MMSREQLEYVLPGLPSGVPSLLLEPDFIPDMSSPPLKTDTGTALCHRREDCNCSRQVKQGSLMAEGGHFKVLCQRFPAGLENQDQIHFNSK